MELESTPASLPYGVVRDDELGGWLLVVVDGLWLVDPPYLYPTRDGALRAAEERSFEDREEQAARRRFGEELARLREQ
jgi:hypothetical protein